MTRVHSILAGTHGLILCGGQSSRMGTDKALIPYHHHLPQYHFLEKLLGVFCETVWISCRPGQEEHFPNHLNLVPDELQYEQAGPMTGLLSAMHQQPGHNWLVVGCDYPFLGETDLAQLLEAIDGTQDAVCFLNPLTGVEEPLLAWYNARTFALLQAAYLQKQTSLRRILSTLTTSRVTPRDIRSITSIDYPDQSRLVLTLLESEAGHPYPFEK